MTNTDLRAKIREVVASGDLTSERPVIYGTGAEAMGTRSARRRSPPDTCLICTEPEPTVSYFWTGGRVAHLHAACDAVWKQERSDAAS